MNRDAEWARAYAKQAKADLAARETLLDNETLPECEQLHFLQMACEKLAKAHAYTMKAVPKKIARSHNFIRKFLPSLYAQEFLNFKGRPMRAKTQQLKHILHLAQEIEFLQPAIDNNRRRPDNCEYPWEDGAGIIQVPMEQIFSNLNVLNEPVGLEFLKLLKSAAERMSQPYKV